MEDYFDSNRELENELEKNGKKKRLEEIKNIPKMANFIYVRQRSDLPYGNATPLLSAAPVIDPKESFVYMYGDDLTFSKTPVIKQLIDFYKESSPEVVMAVQEVPEEEVHKYGTVRYKKASNDKYEIEEACEKFPPEKAPSRMASFGRFVFSSEMIKKAYETSTGKDGELWIMDIINNLAKEGKKIIAPPIEGEWCTTGDPLNYLKTSFKFALQRKDIREELREYLKKII